VLDQRTPTPSAYWATLTVDLGAVILPVAIAELKRPGWQRIRFEFNAIPDELDLMLADLAGRGNPDVAWAEVPMGEEP
jgi:hypothetical protein